MNTPTAQRTTKAEATSTERPREELRVPRSDRSRTWVEDNKPRLPLMRRHPFAPLPCGRRLLSSSSSSQQLSGWLDAAAMALASPWAALRYLASVSSASTAARISSAVAVSPSSWRPAPSSLTR